MSIKKNADEAKTFERRLLKISEINWKGGTQARLQMSKEAVTHYAYLMRNGTEFPPVVVFFDGVTYWPGDGFHRAAAHRVNKETDVLCEIRAGGQREARMFGITANARHGQGLSLEDCRRALIWLLSDKSWADSQSNHGLAKMTGLDHKTVAAWRLKVNERLAREELSVESPRKVNGGGMPKPLNAVR